MGICLAVEYGRYELTRFLFEECIHAAVVYLTGRQYLRLISLTSPPCYATLIESTKILVRLSVPCLNRQEDQHEGAEEDSPSAEPQDTG